MNRKKPFTMGWITLISACLISLIQNFTPFAHAAEGNRAKYECLATLPAGSHSSEHIYGDLPGLTNVGRVAPGIYRGAQPETAGYATLKRMGVKTVINLRTSMSEKKAVEAAGMRSIEVPIEMSSDHIRPKVDWVVALMADPANRPLFVHCRQGQDRTGIVVAAYRMKEEGWKPAEAEAEMQSFGFNDVWVKFKQFIREYGKQLDRGSR
jgi:protein tyrosine/serine phosphatase